MRSVNYIPRGGPDRAADRVVDLAAWKAEHLIVPEGPEAGQPGAPGRCGDRGPVRRRRRRPAILDWAELAATLAVTAAFLALTARVLLF